jgi:hypothetical protein
MAPKPGVPTFDVGLREGPKVLVLGSPTRESWEHFVDVVMYVIEDVSYEFIPAPLRSPHLWVNLVSSNSELPEYVSVSSKDTFEDGSDR